MILSSSLVRLCRWLEVLIRQDRRTYWQAERLGHNETSMKVIIRRPRPQWSLLFNKLRLNDCEYLKSQALMIPSATCFIFRHLVSPPSRIDISPHFAFSGNSNILYVQFQYEVTSSFYLFSHEKKIRNGEFSLWRDKFFSLSALLARRIVSGLYSLVWLAFREIPSFLCWISTSGHVSKMRLLCAFLPFLYNVKVWPLQTSK